MATIVESIGRRVFQLRQRKNLTQEEVGNLIGRSAGHISNIENGKSELFPSEIEKLATELEVTPLSLFAGVSSEVNEIVDLIARMDDHKRRLAMKLFKLNLEMMEVSKNWPSDAVNA